MYAYIYVKCFCNHGNMVTMSFSTSQPDSQKQSKLESAVSEFCTQTALHHLPGIIITCGLCGVK